MAREDLIELSGVVIDVLPGTKFKVQAEYNGMTFETTCHLSGKLRQNYIRVLNGDRVTIAVSPYDLHRGRIIWRSK